MESLFKGYWDIESLIINVCVGKEEGPEFILEFYPKTSRWKMVPLTQEKRMLSREKDGKEGMIINGLWGFEF